MSVKTVSLETAKLLKESGFPQFTHMCFALENKGGQNWEYELMPNHFQAELEFIGAPITDELLNELPTAHERLGNLMFKKVIRKKVVKYQCTYGNQDESPSFEDESLPEVLAKMWLYLKKENLL